MTGDPSLLFPPRGERVAPTAAIHTDGENALSRRGQPGCPSTSSAVGGLTSNEWTPPYTYTPVFEAKRAGMAKRPVGIGTGPRVSRGQG